MADAVQDRAAKCEMTGGHENHRPLSWALLIWYERYKLDGVAIIWRVCRLVPCKLTCRFIAEYSSLQRENHLAFA